ncbi:conserved protein of unknown function [Candidatus Hydrogenisulfobacillus filiaventi]|uniref:DUF4321 domain-containing protein n=1 Tax=Candidatus Hydrogenisulfobacillus filiaventi TaxID=2707344 RepID=A0A6F8ZIY0_9FIRM|nr:conserved protein of unknown function [Candidatus Hydrogenisulfobacillus filiaventi]
MRKRSGSFGVALLFILVGAVAGDVIGRLLMPLWAVLGRDVLALGSPDGRPWTLSAGILGIQLGGWLQVNLMGLVGMLGGLAWYLRRA